MMSCEIIIPSSDSSEQQETLELPEDKPSDPDLSESFVNNYYSHCNALSKGIISEQKSLAKFLGDKWRELDYIKKDSLLDLLFVEDDVRQVAPVSRHVEEQDIPESFPRLYVNAGQKINVDYENDLWTWRDEHSGPFSWMSRSQQDLTLADLDNENVLKPQPKSLRLDLENPENVKKPEPQFTYPANCWTRDIIDELRKDEKNITISPCTSIEFPPSPSRNLPEKDNASKKIQESVTANESSNQTNGETEDLNVIDDTAHRRKNSGKDRRKRSPSPKKMLRSSSLKRSPSKASDGGEQQLISDSSKDQYEEMNAFSNPLVETEWSSFVNENGRESNDNSNIAPRSQVMDRGGEMFDSSPYQVQRDKVHLISPTESPAQSGKTYAATNDLGGWSSESTPDHTTHLLKGMEKDGVKKQEFSASQLSSQEPSFLNKVNEEHDEILTIENFGTDFNISTTTETKRESSIPTTGFDFLDNW